MDTFHKYSHRRLDAEGVEIGSVDIATSMTSSGCFVQDLCILYIKCRWTRMRTLKRERAITRASARIEERETVGEREIDREREN